MFELIKSIRQRDPAQPTFFEVVLAYPGFHVLGFYKLAHLLWRWRFKALARFCAHIGRWITGIEIHPAARIGKRLFIDHGMGVVIGETAELGDDITIYHGVTLGGRGDETSGKRHPTLGNNVMIGSGAQVLGNIILGDDCRVGANAVLTIDMPAGCTAVGNPARLVNCEAKNATYGLPEKDTPDPVGETLAQILVDMNKIKKELKGPLQNSPAEETTQDEDVTKWAGDSI